MRTESSNDNGEEARLINHHGTSIPAGGTDIPSEHQNDSLFDRKASLIHRNEAVEVQVRWIIYSSNVDDFSFLDRQRRAFTMQSMKKNYGGSSA